MDSKVTNVLAPKTKCSKKNHKETTNEITNEKQVKKARTDFS